MYFFGMQIVRDRPYKSLKLVQQQYILSDSSVKLARDGEKLLRWHHPRRSWTLPEERIRCLNNGPGSTTVDRVFIGAVHRCRLNTCLSYVDWCAEQDL
jgi:hypothetical protein